MDKMYRVPTWKFNQKLVSVPNSLFDNLRLYSSAMARMDGRLTLENQVLSSIYRVKDIVKRNLINEFNGIEDKWKIRD